MDIVTDESKLKSMKRNLNSFITVNNSSLYEET